MTTRQKSSRINITGERGALEAIYSGSAEKNSNQPTALLLHPQPSSNGTMYNPVIQEAFSVFSEMGFATLAINFGGVSSPENKIEDGMGELLDASSALKWLCDTHPYAKSRWVFGFSFGAFIAAQISMRRPEIDHFILVSTPIDIYDFSFFVPWPVQGLAIHSTHDNIVPENKILTALARNDKCKLSSYFRLRNINHFLTNTTHLRNLLNPAVYHYVKNHSPELNIIEEYENELVSYYNYSDYVQLLEETTETIANTILN